MTISTELRAAARPFIDRTLRGPRRRRNVVLSLVLAMVTCVLGAWVALGGGEFEAGIRETVGLERSLSSRMHDHHVYVARDRWSVRDAKFDRMALLQGDRELGALGGPVASMVMQGVQTAEAAVRVDRVPPVHADLLARTRAALARHPSWTSTELVGRSYGFDWHRPQDVARLEVIVANDFVPTVEAYASPLSARDAIGVMGLFAGFMLLVLGTVFGPVLVGIAIGQEAHENTLQPLTGTSLSPRQIAIGMLVGPFAPVAIVAAPQVVLALAAAVVVGQLLPVLSFFAVLVACAWVLATLAQVVGLHAGKRRGPGTVGISLLALASTWALSGLVLGLEGTLSRGKAAAMTLLTSGALGHFLREAFVLPASGETGSIASSFSPSWFAARLVVAVLACLVIGSLAMLATERRIFGRFGTPLLRHETWLAVGVLATLTLLAVPEGPTQAWLGTLAMLVMPMQILVMGRVPIGDAPEGALRVRTGALLGEFAGLVGIHAALALLLLGPGWLGALQPVAVVQLGWGLFVAALVSIRVVARPARLPTLVWGGFAYVLAIVTFASGVAGLAGSGRHEQIFVLWQASPVLGLAQAVLTLAIPVLFVRALQRPAKMNALAKDDV